MHTIKPITRSEMDAAVRRLVHKTIAAVVAITVVFIVGLLALVTEGWADPVVAAVAGICGTSVAGMVVAMLWRIVKQVL
jgi:CHASE2 domain-containing sensor protein